MEYKRLYDISWQVDEPTYRADSALSYSIIAKFAREGFNKLNSLFDRIDTPSLTFGSAVDALITGGTEEFNNNFIVADYPPITDSVLKVVKAAFKKYNAQYISLSDIPTENLIALTEELAYQLNWKPETRVKVIKEQGAEYYSLLYIAKDKTLIDIKTKEQVDAAVSALKHSKATEKYFALNNPFNPAIYREYQLKFKATIDNVDYRCMADLLVVDHEHKIVYPVDLKTSSHTEWDFYQSFVQWRYDIQSRLYWRIIRINMDKDPIFKDYKLADYRFIVVNKYTLTPLVWICEFTTTLGSCSFGPNNEIVFEDPTTIGSTLHTYLTTRPAVPKGININEDNSLTKWLNHFAI